MASGVILVTFAAGFSGGMLQAIARDLWLTHLSHQDRDLAAPSIAIIYDPLVGCWRLIGRNKSHGTRN
jgi:hypothetical protein